jgi:hypothetical protein
MFQIFPQKMIMEEDLVSYFGSFLCPASLFMDASFLSMMLHLEFYWKETTLEGQVHPARCYTPISAHPALSHQAVQIRRHHELTDLNVLVKAMPLFCHRRST